MRGVSTLATFVRRAGQLFTCASFEAQDKNHVHYSSFAVFGEWARLGDRSQHFHGLRSCHGALHVLFSEIKLILPDPIIGKAIKSLCISRSVDSGGQWRLAVVRNPVGRPFVLLTVELYSMLRRLIPLPNPHVTLQVAPEKRSRLKKVHAGGAAFVVGLIACLMRRRARWIARQNRSKQLYVKAQQPKVDLVSMDDWGSIACEYQVVLPVVLPGPGPCIPLSQQSSQTMCIERGFACTSKDLMMFLFHPGSCFWDEWQADRGLLDLAIEPWIKHSDPDRTFFSLSSVSVSQVHACILFPPNAAILPSPTAAPWWHVQVRGNGNGRCNTAFH